MAKLPEIKGHCTPRFENVANAMAKQVRHFGGGAAACVYHDGEKVVDVWCGKARRHSAWTEETMAISYSGTKGVIATAVHILASDGKLDYDAPVAKYWPEFAQNGKAEITVRQLLSHQAGLHRVLPLFETTTDMLDWNLIASRLAAQPPAFTPGTANAYHAITFGWLAGELVRRLSGMSVPDFLRERIAKPLQLDGFYIGDAARQLDRIADIFALPSIHRQTDQPLRTNFEPPAWLPPGPWRNMFARGITPGQIVSLYRQPAFWDASIPAFNGVFTARSMAKMYAALADERGIDGVTLVKPAILAKATETQTRRLDKVAIYPLHWKLGYHRADAFVMNVPEAFGHFGLGGSGGWANPKLKLAGALVHNGFPLLPDAQVRVVTLTGEIYRALGIYKGVLRTALDKKLVDLRA